MGTSEKTKCKKIINLFNNTDYSIFENEKYGFIIFYGLSLEPLHFESIAFCKNSTDLYKELFEIQQIALFFNFCDEIENDVYCDIKNYIESGKSEEKIYLKYLTEEQFKIFNYSRKYYFTQSQKILN